MRRGSALGVGTAAIAALAFGLGAGGSPAATTSSARALVQPLDTWVTDGDVNSIDSDAQHVFLGGWFRLVGPPTGPGVALDPISGERDPAFARVDGGPVNAVSEDGSGGFFIGGEFTSVGGIPRAGLAHVLTDGSVDPAWNPGAEGPVRALLRVGDRVYVAGGFTAIAGAAQARLAAVDATTGALSDWRPSVTGWLYTLAASQTTLYIGGELTAVNGAVRDGGAAFDLAGGQLTQWDPAVLYSRRIYAIAPYGSQVYIGGDFDHVGNWGRYALARVDATTGAIDTSWTPDANSDVRALAVDGGRLYVGGAFTQLAGAQRVAAAAFDLTTGALTPWSPTAGQDRNWGLSVLSLHASGSRVLLGGTFATINGEERFRLAAVDATSGALDRTFDPRPNGPVLAIAASGSRVYAGGKFASVNGVRRQNLAALDLATGALDTSWRADTDATGIVYDLDEAGGRLYVGGNFIALGGAVRANLAAVDAATAAVLPWDPQANGGVGDVKFADGRVLVGGGWFTHVGGLDERGLTSLDPDTGAAAAWNLAPDDDVFDLWPVDGRVYVASEFLTIGGQPRHDAAALDTAAGSVLAWDPHADRTVWEVAATPARVYMVGNFGTIGTTPRWQVAAVDRDAGAVDAAWYPNGSVDGSVWSVTTFGTRVFFGGSFLKWGAAERDGLVEVDAATGEATSWWPYPDFTVRVIHVTDTTVYVGGDTNNYSLLRRGFAAFPLPPVDGLDTTPLDTRLLSWPAKSSTYTSASFGFASTKAGSFECSLDAAPYSPCRSRIEYTGLAVGTHAFAVRAVDLAGNVDASPAEFTWEVLPGDSTPPETAITSGPSDGTTSTTATFSFASSEDGTFDCAIDSLSWSACASPLAYDGLAPGSHTYRAAASGRQLELDAYQTSSQKGDTFSVDEVTLIG